VAVVTGPATRLGSAGESLEEHVMSQSHHVDHFVVPVSQESVPQSRNLTRATLACWGFALGDQIVDDIAVIVTELVTNSVVHAAEVTSNVAVTLRLWRGRVTVEVFDGHPHRPRLSRAPAADEHGRGLHIIHHLALEWDGCVGLRTCPGRPGKSVVVMLESGTALLAQERASEERASAMT
jgi:anti-sigma regulatory factor (Ser/Thr protein kinase)